MFGFLFIGLAYSTNICLKLNKELNCPEASAENEVNTIQDLYSSISTTETELSIDILSTNDSVSLELSQLAIIKLTLNGSNIIDLHLIVPNEKMRFSTFAISNAHVTFEKVGGNAEINAGKFYFTTTTFAGNVPLLGEYLYSNFASISGLPALSVSQIHLTANSYSQIPSENITIKTNLLSSATSYYLTGFARDAIADIKDETLYLSFANGAIVTIERGYFYFTLTNPYTTFGLNSTKLTWRSLKHVLTLQEGTHARVHIVDNGNYNSIDIRSVGTSTLDLADSSDIESIIVSGGRLTIKANNQHHNLQAITVSDNGEILFENNDAISFTASKIELKGSPYIGSLSALNMQVEDLTIGNVSRREDFGMNMKFHVTRSFKVDDIDFAMPWLELNDDCEFSFISDTTPKEGLYVTEKFVPPTKPIKLQMRGFTYTPSDEMVKQLVEQPTYMFCAPDLDCDNMSISFVGNYYQFGFNNELNLTKNVCQKPKEDSKYKCFGFQLTDYPFQYRPYYHYIKAGEKYYPELGEWDGKKKVSDLVNEKTQKISFIVDANTEDDTIDLTGVNVGHKIDLNIIRFRWTETKASLTIPADTSKILGTLSWNFGPLEIKTKEEKAVLSCDSLEMILSAQISTDGSKVSLSGVKNALLPIDELNNFDYSEIQKIALQSSMTLTVSFTEEGWTIAKGSGIDITYNPNQTIIFRQTHLLCKKIDDKIHPLHLNLTNGNGYTYQFDNSWNNYDGVALVMHDAYSVVVTLNGNTLPIDFINEQKDCTFINLENKASVSTVTLPHQSHTSGIRIIFKKEMAIKMKSLNITGSGTFEAQTLIANGTIEIENLVVNNGAHPIIESLKLNNVTVMEKGALELWDCRILVSHIVVKGNLKDGFGQLVLRKPREQRPLSLVVEWTTGGINGDVNTSFKILDVTGTSTYANWSSVVSFNPSATESGFEIALVKDNEDTLISLVGHAGKAESNAGFIAGVTIGVTVGVAAIVAIVVYFYCCTKVCAGCILYLRLKFSKGYEGEDMSNSIDSHIVANNV